MHGYDPDHAPSNISRLIFKIGGLRSEGSLMDKFSSVLEGMGINLEIVDSSEQQQPDSSSVKSSASGGVDQTGTFSVSPRYDARRRRNSESAAPSAPTEDLRDVPTMFTGRARSASFGSQAGDGMVNFRATGDENRPPRQRMQPQKTKSIEPEYGDVEEQRLRALPLRPLLVRGDETDDGFPYRLRGAEDYPESASEHVEEYVPTDVYEGQVGREYDLPGIRYIPNHYVGSSDTTAQTSDELPAEPMLTEEDRELMEGDARHFQTLVVRDRISLAVAKWRDEARGAAQRHRHQEAKAAEYDRKAVITEAIATWRATAQVAERERLASQGPARDADEDTSLERRAAWCYDKFIMSKAFVHWFRSAKDEGERTAIARKYILRKRYFDAWRSHQVDIETKVHNFRLVTLLRTWRRAAIHQDVRENVATQRYRHNLARNVFETWWNEYRARYADDFWAYHLSVNCLVTWQGETRRISADFERSVYEDRRFTLAEALLTWREEAEETRRTVYACTQRRVLIDLQKTFQAWRTQARLHKNLREFSEERDRRTKTHAMGQWIAQAGEADHMAWLAKRLLVQEFVAHWRNEAKLRRYRGQKVRELKFAILSHWRLEHELASYQRLCERRTKQHVLAKLRIAAAEAQTEAVKVLQTAHTVAEHRKKFSVLSVWRRRTSVTLNKQHAAAYRHSLSLADSCLGHWYTRAGEEATRTADLEGFAARGAYYVATSNVLDSWAKVTKQARKERLTRSYHGFRRIYKVNMAARCLATWRVATRDSHGLSYDADNVYGAHLRDQLAGCVQVWRNTTGMMRVIREVASTADQEVWWGKWSRRAKDLGETELDAAEYSNDQTVSRCWRTWEFAVLQNKGRQHVVATLQENNDKKLCRQVISQWSQKAAYCGAYPDLRSSAASRRSVRYGSVRAIDTPRFGGSVIPPSSQPQPVAEQLPHIDEDLSDIYTATPRRPFGRASEPARNPFLSAPAGLSQSLPHRPSGFSILNSTPVAATPQGLTPIPFPDSTRIPPTSPSYMSAQGLPSQPRPPHQPRSDFDEDAISFAPSEGNDYQSTFMSTPTRRAGKARPLLARTQHPPPFRKAVAGAGPTTTTPSAPLDTPYERALRREYGGSGILASEKGSAVGAWRMATPKVTFADIREESGEGMYDEG